MSDAFSRPARLSPLMARALLLALELLGDAVKMDETESLASVRDKVRSLAGPAGGAGTVLVDDVIRPPADLFDVLNGSIRDHRVVEIEYFTLTRGSLSRRSVEPYLLFHSAEGWYLEGFCLEARAQRTFRLEFIRSAAATTDVFEPRPEIDLSRRVSGEPFTSGSAVSWASVRFAPRWRQHLDDRGIEYEALPDGSLSAQIPFLDERWMIREVVRFLGDATLESPAPTREAIRRSAAATAALYEDERTTAEDGGR